MQHPVLATLSALTLVLASAVAPAQTATLVPAQSEIVFVSRQMGVPVEGRFEHFDAKLAFNPTQVSNSSVSISIDMTSARFGMTETDVELAKPTWLGSAKFPQAIFQSTAFKSSAAGRYEVDGKLTIKGATQDVTVPVALAQIGVSSTATGTFTVKRLDFRIGDGEWSDTSLVANDVKVRFKLVFTGIGRLP
jgi:polyisoprenoid-binding protein YceI